MNQLELNAELREDMGKGASRRLRRAGKLPGVVFGAEKDATSITLEHDYVASFTVLIRYCQVML